MSEPTTIAPWLSVPDASAAVAFYRAAFGAVTAQALGPEDELQVAELRIDGASFWVQRDDDLPADADPGRAVRMIVSVADPDAAFDRAVGAGATAMVPPHDEHGWRTGRVGDPFRHQWELARHLH